MEFTAKDFAERPHWQEKLIVGVNPTCVIKGRAAGWNHTVDMRVMLQCLSPGMQHTQEADLGSKMFGIGCEFQ